MGWAAGFQAGTALGRQIVDTYNQAKQAQELEGLQKEAAAGPQMSSQFTDKTAADLTAASQQPGATTTYNPATGGYDVDYGNAAAGAGYEEGLMNQRRMFDPQRSYSYMGQQFSAAPTQAEQNQAYTSRLIRAVGLTNPADAARLMAASRAEDRAAESAELAKQAARLQIDAAKRAAQQAAGEDRADQALAAAIQNGQLLSPTDLAKIASDSGVPTTRVVSQYAAHNKGVDDIGQMAVNMAVRDLNTAWAKGEGAANALLARTLHDPNTEDSITPHVGRTKDGSWAIFYGTEMLPQYGSNKDWGTFGASLSAMLSGNAAAFNSTLVADTYRRAATEMLGAQRDMYAEKTKQAKAETGLFTGRADREKQLGALRDRAIELDNMIAGMTPEELASPNGQKAVADYNRAMQTLSGKAPAPARAGGAGAAAAPAASGWEFSAMSPEQQFDYAKEMVGKTVKLPDGTKQTLGNVDEAREYLLRKERAPAAAPARDLATSEVVQRLKSMPLESRVDEFRKITAGLPPHVANQIANQINLPAAARANLNAPRSKPQRGLATTPEQSLPGPY